MRDLYIAGVDGIDIGDEDNELNLDFPEEGTEEVDAEGVGEGEGALTEAKRYVRRYYIRPQNIFCSKKSDILQALAKDVGEENCSVYSLKSLGDHDDVHLLQPSDIIYYYDDGILYDKEKTILFRYPTQRAKEYVMPDSVKETYEGAFGYFCESNMRYKSIRLIPCRILVYIIMITYKISSCIYRHYQPICICFLIPFCSNDNEYQSAARGTRYSHIL